MKILLFGASGLLGRHLRAYLPQCGHRLAAFTHAEADIADTGRVADLFQRPWDVVINTAAICSFDACEEDPANTGRINLDAPLNLARHCATSGALFVQFSSDYVFDGKAAHALTEEDKPAPLSAYGRQKAALEHEVPPLCPRSLVIRLSWLYGTGGRTFMSLLPDLLLAKGSLDVASGKRGACLYAADAAMEIERLISANQTGLFNLANAGETSWEEFARCCATRLGLPPDKIREVPYGDIGPHWALRPRFSCLDVGKLARTLPPGPRPWLEALDAFLAEWKSVAARRHM